MLFVRKSVGQEKDRVKEKNRAKSKGTEAIGCGTCAIAVYDQEAMARFLRIDDEDEFVIHIATVEKVKIWKC